MEPYPWISPLKRYYALEQVQVVRQFETKGQRCAYLLQTERGGLVVKITDPDRSEEIVKSDTAILAYLERFDFPATRLIANLDGQLYLPFENRFLYLYTYLQGTPPRASTRFFQQAGSVLARLHSLPIDEAARTSLYRPAYMLDEIREFVSQAPGTPEQQDMAGEILVLVDEFPSFENLPEGLIHTDPYFSNFVEMASGALALIDWEDAGISYPLIDVGYMGHLTTFLPNDRKNWKVDGEGEIVWRPDWAQEFLNAYQQVRPLSSLEKEYFSAAVRLNFLIYLWDWNERRLIPENYRRMKLLEQFRPSWV